MLRLSTIELAENGLQFSAGHFTIFSADHRENIHGHNYQLKAEITTIIDDEGLRFDYRHYINKLRDLCKTLNSITLAAEKNKYTTITEDGTYYYIQFANEKLIFLKRDLKILPIYNITIEELAYWFLQQLLADTFDLETNQVQKLVVKISSGQGKWGSASWERK